MEGLNITKCPNLYIKHEDYAEIEYFGEYRGCNPKFSYLLEDQKYDLAVFIYCLRILCK